MNQNHKSFADRMAEGQDNAQIARNKGLHTGKSAAGWNVKRPKESANDNCAWLHHWRLHWQSLCAEIRNDFSRVARSQPGETWEL